MKIWPKIGLIFHAIQHNSRSYEKSFLSSCVHDEQFSLSVNKVTDMSIEKLLQRGMTATQIERANQKRTKQKTWEAFTQTLDGIREILETAEDYVEGCTGAKNWVRARKNPVKHNDVKHDFMVRILEGARPIPLYTTESVDKKGKPTLEAVTAIPAVDLEEGKTTFDDLYNAITADTDNEIRTSVVGYLRGQEYKNLPDVAS